MEGSGTGIGSDPVVKTDAAGNPIKAEGAGANGSGTGSSVKSPSPEAENLEFAKAKGWVGEDGAFKTADILKGYQTLEQHLGKTVVVPDDKSTDVEREAFHRRLGWTGKAEDYKFAAPADMPKDVPYNSELAEAFTNWANEERLPVPVAKSMHDRFVKFQVEAITKDVAAYAQQVDASAKTAHETFVKEWGATETPAYKENLEASRRAFNDPKLAGLADVLKANGLMTKDGNFTSFEIGHLLSNHGKQFLNDKFVAPNSGGHQVVGNPFQKKLSDGTENPSFNMTEAGRIVKENPNEARRLILAAGEDPAAYQL